MNGDDLLKQLIKDKGFYLHPTYGLDEILKISALTVKFFHAYTAREKDEEIVKETLKIFDEKLAKTLGEKPRLIPAFVSILLDIMVECNKRNLEKQQ